MLIVTIVLVFLFFIILAFFVFMADSFFGKEDFHTTRTEVSQFVKIVKDRRLENRRIYDLGSSKGSFVLRVSKALPAAKVTGIDDSNFRILFAKLRAIFLKNISFHKANIFQTDLTAADIVYIYLPQEMMAGLEAKLQKELKSGALVITNKVNFPNWQPTEKIEKLFIYQIA